MERKTSTQFDLGRFYGILYDRYSINLNNVNSACDIDLNVPFSETGIAEIKRAVQHGKAIRLDLSKMTDRLKEMGLAWTYKRVVHRIVAFADLIQAALDEMLPSQKVTLVLSAPPGNAPTARDFPISYLLRESLKNAFVHGNRLDVSLPIVFLLGFDGNSRLSEIIVFDANRPESSEELEINLVATGLSGRRVFVDSLISGNQASRELVCFEDGAGKAVKIRCHT